MQWNAEGVVLSSRRHGETSVIIEVFTKEFGRCAGLVRGGTGRRLRPVLQPGNSVHAEWKARLSEHLGVFTVEATTARVAGAMAHPETLAALTSICALLRFLPERNGYPRLYDTTCSLLDNLEDEDVWLPLLVRFELALLEETGFGLDLESCAANGSNLNLTHISPRSGRAVSAEAAEPYLDKLFPMPQFFRDSTATVSLEDVKNGLTITGHFLTVRILHQLEQNMPESRARLIHMLDDLADF